MTEPRFRPGQEVRSAILAGPWWICHGPVRVPEADAVGWVVRPIQHTPAHREAFLVALPEADLSPCPIAHDPEPETST